MVGMAGFEPTAPRPPDECSGQAELHPDGWRVSDSNRPRWVHAAQTHTSSPSGRGGGTRTHYRPGMNRLPSDRAHREGGWGGGSRTRTSGAWSRHGDATVVHPAQGSPEGASDQDGCGPRSRTWLLLGYEPGQLTGAFKRSAVIRGLPAGRSDSPRTPRSGNDMGQYEFFKSLKIRHHSGLHDPPPKETPPPSRRYGEPLHHYEERLRVFQEQQRMSRRDPDCCSCGCMD